MKDSLLKASECNITLEEAFELYNNKQKYIAVGHNGSFVIMKEE
jgi:hypothetical protein